MLRRAPRGYARRAVDQFLVRCAASLGERAASVDGLPEPPTEQLPPLDAGDVQEVRFPVVMGGYDMAQVDALLTQVAQRLPGAGERPDWPVPAAAPPDAPALALKRAVQGYDPDQVLEFLTRCAHTLGPRIGAVPELGTLLDRPRPGSPVRARDVEMVQFRLRLGGVSVEQVDRLLDRVAAALGS